MSPTVITEARRLHKVGYDLIPLNGKRPIATNWVAAPRLNLQELESQLVGRNVGVRLGQPMEDGRYIACLDVDVIDKLKTAERSELDQAIKEVLKGQSAPIAVTGYGQNSRHIYVATDQPAKTRKLAQAQRQASYSKGGSAKKGPVWTLELRGLGAQVVLPPSTHPDTNATYRWKRRLNGASNVPTLALIPTEGSLQTNKRQAPELANLAIAPLYRHLLTTGETEDYSSRSEALYAVVSVLVRDTDLTDEEIEALVLSYPLGAKAQDRPTGWVAGQCAKIRLKRIDPMNRLSALPKDSTLDDLKPIFEDAAKLGLSKAERDEFLNLAKKLTGISKAALTSEFDSTRGNTSDQRPRLAHGDPVYEEVCARHVIVSWGGKPAVFRQRKNPPAWEGRYDIMTLSSLATFYENKPVMLGKNAANPVEIWRADAERKEFLEGARLVPPEEKCPADVFNLWQGFAVTPKPGDTSTWSEFVFEVICHGHKGYFSWLEDWIADMFQNIGSPKGVAIVMRGEEGIGKGTFANALGHLMGGHYRHVTQESQLTGRFNSHFADSTLIFADELIWGGDKKHKGALYAIVTEKYLMVERKNFDAVPMRNFNRMIVASNNDWVVPTGMGGRRWFVLDVDAKYKGKTSYFKKLREKLDYEALLHHYLNHQISHDLRIAPVTKGLIDQKQAGFDSVTAWWTAVLDRGCIRPPIGDAISDWEERISKEMVRNSYHTYCKDYSRHIVYDVWLFRALKKMTPWMRSVRGNEDGNRVQQVEFPTLDVCREYMVDMLGRVEEEVRVKDENEEN